MLVRSVRIPLWRGWEGVGGGRQVSIVLKDNTVISCTGLHPVSPVMEQASGHSNIHDVVIGLSELDVV